MAIDITYMPLADALEAEVENDCVAILFFDRGQPVPADARTMFREAVIVRANDVDRRVVWGLTRVAAANNHRRFGIGWLCALVLGDRGPRRRRRRWRAFTMLDALRIARFARGLTGSTHVRVGCRRGRSRSRTTATVIAAATGSAMRRPGGRVNDWVEILLERAFRLIPEPHP